jgi:hypothetical protein
VLSQNSIFWQRPSAFDGNFFSTSPASDSGKDFADVLRDLLADAFFIDWLLLAEAFFIGLLSGVGASSSTGQVDEDPLRVLGHGFATFIGAFILKPGACAQPQASSGLAFSTISSFSFLSSSATAFSASAAISTSPSASASLFGSAAAFGAAFALFHCSFGFLSASAPTTSPSPSDESPSEPSSFFSDAAAAFHFHFPFVILSFLSFTHLPLVVSVFQDLSFSSLPSLALAAFDFADAAFALPFHFHFAFAGS